MTDHLPGELNSAIRHLEWLEPIVGGLSYGAVTHYTANKVIRTIEIDLDSAVKKSFAERCLSDWSSLNEHVEPLINHYIQPFYDDEFYQKIKSVYEELISYLSQLDGDAEDAAAIKATDRMHSLLVQCIRGSNHLIEDDLFSLITEDLDPDSDRLELMVYTSLVIKLIFASVVLLIRDKHLKEA